MGRFDDDFEVDPGIEESIESMLDYFKELKENAEERVELVNINRMQQMQFAYRVIKHITADKSVKVSYKLHEPSKTMGSIRIEGRSVLFDSPLWFSRIAEFATNTEIYPLEKDKVRVTFTFYGLTDPVE